MSALSCMMPAMRLYLLTSLTMLAFAANSVLNRMAVADGAIDTTSFATIRLVSGAIVLSLIVLARDKRLTLWGPGRVVGVLSLFIYMFGFSIAYRVLDAGIGALILFAGVQITMFVGALRSGETISRQRWLGAALALGGLFWLLWPGTSTAPALFGVAFMGAAAIGWGVFSLAGRKIAAPLQAMAANFVLAAVLTLIVLPFLPSNFAMSELTIRGVALACLSGVVTSGLGYALWYAVLPKLQTTQAAIAQLTVPVIAMAGGMLFLGENLTLQFVIASALVLGGVGVSSRR